MTTFFLRPFFVFLRFFCTSSLGGDAMTSATVILSSGALLGVALAKEVVAEHNSDPLLGVRLVRGGVPVGERKVLRAERVQEHGPGGRTTPSGRTSGLGGTGTWGATGGGAAATGGSAMVARRRKNETCGPTVI